jgi:outer membrane protein assembly factor BamB
VVVGKRVFIGTTSGLLLALDVASGSKAWEYDAGAAITAGPAAGQGRLVVGTLDGVVYCFGAGERAHG